MPSPPSGSHMYCHLVLDGQHGAERVSEEKHFCQGWYHGLLSSSGSPFFSWKCICQHSRPLALGSTACWGVDFRRKPLATRENTCFLSSKGEVGLGLYLVGRVLTIRSEGLGLIRSTIQLRKKYG